MKSLILAALITLSSSVSAVETLNGTFSLNNADYVLTVSYDLTKDQEASGKFVRFFESSVFPETGEVFPAHCSYNMSFTVPYTVVIKSSTGEIVYSKNSIENFLGSAEGGLMSEGKCNWIINGWSSKVATQMRITEHSFIIKKASYRFFLDTYAMIDAVGSKAATITAENYSPIKGNDGKKDGEVWIDTQPDANGNYSRVWAPLSL